MGHKAAVIDAEFSEVNPSVVDGALEAMNKTNGAANSEAPLSSAEVLAYDDVIKRYAKTIRFGWFELGDAATVIKTRELWKQYPAPDKEEPFHSWDDYVNRRGQKSRTAIYRALQLRTGLSVIPESDCREMSQANAIWLLRMGKRIGEKKAYTGKNINAALTMPEKEFAEFCNDKMPGAAREEQQLTVSWKVDKSLEKVCKQAIQVAMWDTESEDEKVALERIITTYLGNACEHEGLHKLSNLQAYQKSHGKKRQ